jgi:hypothetical protein
VDGDARFVDRSEVLSPPTIGKRRGRVRKKDEGRLKKEKSRRMETGRWIGVRFFILPSYFCLA